MIYKSRVTGVSYIDHDRRCAIWHPVDRACTCTVHFPFPNPAGKWDGWLTATPEQQADMQTAYRGTIRDECEANHQRWRKYK